MQCPSCQFENIPGAEVCGRCGTSLCLSEEPIDVHPPRADRKAKFWRRLFRRQRFLWSRWSQRVAQWETVRRSLPTERSQAGLLLRMLVPGWAHFYVGKVRRGLWFLGLYLVFLLVGGLYWGTTVGSILLGLALCAHLSSILDIIVSFSESGAARVGWTLSCWLAVGVIIYVPVGWGVFQVAVPLRIVADGQPFRAGDVILYDPSPYNSSSEPAVGDVVVYRLPPTWVSLTAQGRDLRYYHIQGIRIDRIIAGPGQEVRWDGKNLQVDGRPSPWLPLNPARLAVPMSFRVPRQYYAILPSTDPSIPPGAQVGVWRAISVVHRENIVGKVLVRHQPLSRFWVVR